MIFGCKNILKKHAEQILLTVTVYIIDILVKHKILLSNSIIHIRSSIKSHIVIFRKAFVIGGKCVIEILLEKNIIRQVNSHLMRDVVIFPIEILKLNKTNIVHSFDY